MNDETTPPSEQPTEPQPPEPKRLTRLRDDRLIAGVCGGLGRYFGVDPVLFRVAAVALVFFGGAGALLYLAAIILIPVEGEEQPGQRSRRDRALAVIGIVLLVGAAVAIFSHGPFHHGWFFGPFAFLAVGALVVWWLVAGDHPRGGGRNAARSIGRALGVLLVCLALAIGGAWLAGTSGTAAAIAVIAAGVALAVGAFAGQGRWLILPALSLALPVAFVAAANIDLHGGAGDKEYAPSSAAQVRDTYRLGAGRLIVDLRDAQLPPGDRPLKLKLGVGEAVLVVPDNVCVATNAKVGMGVVDSFDRSNGGVDVDWSDEPSAPTRNARIVLDADVGLGRLAIGHSVAAAEADHGRRFYRDSVSDETNTGCGVTHAAG